MINTNIKIRIPKKQSLQFDERQRVKEIIGADAEALVYLFCRLDRKSAFALYLEGKSVLPFHGSKEVWNISGPGDRCIADQLLTIEAANLLDQQDLWRNSWLIPHAQRVGLLTQDGYCVLRSSRDYVDRRDAEQLRMLQVSREQAWKTLTQKINSHREKFESELLGSRVLRDLRFAQACLVVQRHEQGLSVDEGADVGLISGHATSYGIPIIDSAMRVLQSRSAFEKMLMQTELFKDQMGGRIAAAKSLSDISRLVMELATRNFAD